VLHQGNAPAAHRIQIVPRLALGRQRVHVALHKRWKRPFGSTGQAQFGKDKQVYQSQLSREAQLIVQGQQEFVRDFAVFWTRILDRLGIGATKLPAADTQPR